MNYSFRSQDRSFASTFHPSNPMNDNIPLREVVFDRFTQTQTSWRALSNKYDISVAKFRVA